MNYVSWIILNPSYSARIVYLYVSDLRLANFSSIPMYRKDGVEVIKLSDVLIPVKDLQFPKLSELGIKSSQRTKRDLDVTSEDAADETNKIDRQIQLVGRELPISDYFERATTQIEDRAEETSPHGKHVIATETSNTEAKVTRTHGPAEEAADSKPAKELERNRTDSTPNHVPATKGENELGMPSPGDTGQNGKSTGKNLELRTLVKTSDTATLSERLQPSGISNGAKDSHPSSTDESYPSMLQNYTHIPPPAQSAPEPVTTDLDSLLQACSVLLPSRPFALSLPLQHKAETEKAHLWKTETIEEEIRVPILTETNSSNIWMYPVNEDGVVRYVTGPPVKKRRIWKPRYRPKPVQEDKLFEGLVYSDLDPITSIAPSFYLSNPSVLPGEYQSLVDRGDLSANPAVATDSMSPYLSNSTTYQPDDSVFQQTHESDYQHDLSMETIWSDDIDGYSDDLSDVVLFENPSVNEEDIEESIPENRFEEGHSALEEYGVSSEVPFDDNWWKDRRRRM